MPDQIATYVQIASILVYVFTVFGLYKLLTTQKDATIQALNAQLELLKVQLKQADANTPDVAVEVMAKRVRVITEELIRLNADNDASAERVTAKERELAIAQEDLADLHKQVTRAEELLRDYACPRCGSLMLSREYSLETIEVEDGEGEILHERIVYHCGYELMDGKEASGKCIVDDFVDLTET